MAEKKFVVNMNVSVCLEPDSCVINLEVFNEMYLPKVYIKYTIMATENVGSFKQILINTGGL
jgi:hypothetical protein